MKKFYKVFLVIFIVFVAINLYAINWQTDILADEDNLKFVFSAAAGIIGLILLFVMDAWSRIGVKK
ncbi:hypothetical protein HX13_05010 [Chryseobacterium sp. P1-3]|uniref:Uncharacterized protein n=1 Tax=Chryseobacterium gallinarum TaxID=1324352 RepID=A0A0G3M0E6_CHRGL|nr:MULTISPECIES: hypothetical protein [Chryseobacterium]AKK71483.1 hypothetical protein OK18_01445 [Chryseobacterium gallinarum]KFF75504.1 hypothetical protein HX13_05010 [Chryseobacterium sp. P1-3]MCL8538779.1 hypothetical protein [Chryseobacterium gallinarum]QIY89268.1 hypothetical protein FOB44_00795 [Chryseobacterium gallinarum]